MLCAADRHASFYCASLSRISGSPQHPGKTTFNQQNGATRRRPGRRLVFLAIVKIKGSLFDFQLGHLYQTTEMSRGMLPYLCVSGYLCGEKTDIFPHLVSIYKAILHGPL